VAGIQTRRLSDGCVPRVRNSAKNHTQPEWATPVGDPSGKARRVSSKTVVRRAARARCQTGAALVLAGDLEGELNLHHRAVLVAHLDCHLVTLRAVQAPRVPRETS
jgi:hypothetical protein